MLHLVYGCPGSGKSRFLAELIAKRLEEGKKVILIVPERFSVSAEQAVTAFVGDHCKMGLDILSFKRLCNRVFREYGGLCYNYAGKGGRMLMMYRALCGVREELQVYKRLELRDSGTVEAMLDSIVSFKRAVLSPELFEKAGEDCKEEQLGRKVKDLAKIWREYDRLLCEKYDDPEEDLSRLYTLLLKYPFFADKEVFVDSAAAFTGQELNILKAAMAQSAHVTVALEFLPEDSREMLEKMRWCRDLLIDAAREVGTETERLAVLEKTCGKSADLIALERWLFGDDSEGYGGEERNLSVNAFDSIYEECKAIAARILRDVQSGGRYMDHAVAVRNIEDYKGIIDQVFEANGLPFTMTDKVCLSGRGAGRLLLSALRLAVNGFRAEDLIDYLKTGLTGLTNDECFLLEDYVNLWQIEGRKRWLSENDFAMNPSGHTAGRSEGDFEKLKTVNEIRRKLTEPLRRLCEDFSVCKTAEDFSSVLFEYMTAMGLEEALIKEAELSHAEKDSREEQLHVQTFKAICEFLDELVYAMGDAFCNAEEYLMMAELLLSKKELGTIPPGKDRVLISDTFNLKPEGVKILHVAGMNEGVFPAFTKESGVFTPGEARLLRTMSVNIPGNEERAVLDEEYLCYTVLSLPKKRLFVTCYKKDLRGRACRPSELFETLETFYKGEQPTYEDLLYGRANCIERALQKGDSPEHRALRDYFAEYSGISPENIQRAALIASSDRLSEETVRKIYRNGPLRLSQSRLEVFVKCPLRYTCQYILGLREKLSAVTGSNEIGTAVHRVFERLIGDCLNQGQAFGLLSDAEIEKRVCEIVSEEERNALGNEENVRVSRLFKRIGDSARILAENLRDEFEQSAFEPVFCELSFGLGREEGKFSLPEVCTEGEDSVALRGTADRVDLFRKEGKLYLRVVDYKTGDRTFNPEDVEKGLNMQMLLYLKALKNCKDPAFLSRLGYHGNEKILPAGVLYFIAKSNMVRLGGEETEETVKEKIRKSIKRSGLLINDRDVLVAMEKELQGKYIPYTPESEKSVVSAEDFEEKLEGLDSVLSGIAKEMRSGKADAASGEKKEKEESCKDCPMGRVCRAKYCGVKEGEE